MNKPTNRISNITESSFVLHFSLNETLNYCGFTDVTRQRISQVIKSMFSSTGNESYYITPIDHEQLNTLPHDPYPSLETAHFITNATQARCDASGNILSFKITMNINDPNYNSCILDGFKKGEYVIIPRAVVVYGEEEYTHYLNPFAHPDAEQPAGTVKLIGFDFLLHRKTFRVTVNDTAQLTELVDSMKAISESQPDENPFRNGGYGTNQRPDIRYPEYVPTYNGVRLSTTPCDLSIQGSVKISGELTNK